MRTEAEIKSALFNWRAVAEAAPLVGQDAKAVVDWAEAQRHALHASQTLDWVLEGPPSQERPTYGVMRERLRTWPGNWDDLGSNAHTETWLIHYLMTGRTS